MASAHLTRDQKQLLVCATVHRLVVAALLLTLAAIVILGSQLAAQGLLLFAAGPAGVGEWWWMVVVLPGVTAALPAWGACRAIRSALSLWGLCTDGSRPFPFPERTQIIGGGCCALMLLPFGPLLRFAGDPRFQLPPEFVERAALIGLLISLSAGSFLVMALSAWRGRTLLDRVANVPHASLIDKPQGQPRWIAALLVKLTTPAQTPQRAPIEAEET